MKALINHIYAFIQTERVKKQLKRYCEVEYNQCDVHAEYDKLINEYYRTTSIKGFL